MQLHISLSEAFKVIATRFKVLSMDYPKAKIAI